MANPSQPAADPSANPPIVVLDLTRQVMTIPGTEYGTVEIPLLAAGDILEGSSSVIGAPQDAHPYAHCEDVTLGWATEPNPSSAAEWARPLQFVTWDRECGQVPSISGHAVILPEVGSIPDGAVRWLRAGLQISVIGKSPYPNPNLQSLAESDLRWPGDRPIRTVQATETEQRKAALAAASAKAVEAFVARRTTAAP